MNNFYGYDPAIYGVNYGMQQPYGMPAYGYGPMYGMPAYSMQQNDNPLSGLLKTGAAAQYNLRGTNLGPMQDIAGQIQNLVNAQIDPNSPQYQKLYRAERGAAQQDLASVIAELQGQNRKSIRMGRTPLLSPERGGETIFRELSRGYQSAQDTARQRARQILGVGQQGLQNVFSNQAALTQAQDVNRKKKTFGLGNIADALPLLGGLF